MNKLTMAALGLSLMAGSLFAAPKQADSTTAPADKTAATGTKSTKKHHRKHMKKAATDTTATPSTTAAPAK